jgi:hypothetical protein
MLIIDGFRRWDRGAAMVMIGFITVASSKFHLFSRVLSAAKLMRPLTVTDDPEI